MHGLVTFRKKGLRVNYVHINLIVHIYPWVCFAVAAVAFSWTWHTVCPRSSDPFYVVTYYIELVTTSWTYSNSVH